MSCDQMKCHWRLNTLVSNARDFCLILWNNSIMYIWYHDIWYIYMYINMYINMYICINMYEYIYIYVYIYICIYIYIHINVYILFLSIDSMQGRSFGSSILKKAISRVQVSLLLRASTGLVAKGCNELTPLRGFQETWRAHFFFQGFNKHYSWSWGWNKIQLWWNHVGIPGWKSNLTIFGPHLPTWTWIFARHPRLSMPDIGMPDPHVDVCMLTNGSPPHEWLGRQRWRSDSGTKGSHSLADQAWDQVFAMTQGW